MAPKRAESVPGRMSKCMSAVLAKGIIRGSTTMSFAPLSLAFQIQWVSVGKVSETLAPVTMITSAFSKS